MRISAVGVLSAYGAGTEALVQGMRNGDCPVRTASGMGYPTDPAPLVSRLPPRNDPPGEQASALALIQTLAQMVRAWGGDPALLSQPDCGLVVGSGGFLYASNAELFWRDSGNLTVSSIAPHLGLGLDRQVHFRQAHLTPFLVRGPSWGASLISAHYRMRGPVQTLSTGCSASANALLLASEMLSRQKLRRVIVVGAEGLSAVTLAGFDSLMLLDPHGCRPFDRDRSGVQLGEAVAALLLEADQDPSAGARSDGSAGTARLIAGANQCDTHHLTSASPDGSVMAAVMREALTKARLATQDMVAIKAHGTGSVDSDAAEANAIKAVFGAAPPPILAFKRYLGHTLGACGALETVALTSCFNAGFMPPAAGYCHRDPRLDIAPLASTIAAQPGHYLLNFFGFGGNYTSLVLRLGPAN